MIQGISQIYLFISGHNTKHLNTALHTTDCLLTINFLIKLSVRGIRKFKKMTINFLLEKSFYSVEEFMTIDS